MNRATLGKSGRLAVRCCPDLPTSASSWISLVPSMLWDMAKRRSVTSTSIGRDGKAAGRAGERVSSNTDRVLASRHLLWHRY
jgi:hypothetical protein